MEHVYFTGRLDHTRLNLLFGCADLAVFPPVLPEAYPLVLMESLAIGVLPCASDLTGLGEGLRDLEPELGSSLVDRLRLPIDPAVRVAGIGQQIASSQSIRNFTARRTRCAASQSSAMTGMSARQMLEAYERAIDRSA